MYGDCGVVEAGDRGFLDRDELAGVEVVFHVAVGADDSLVAADPADAPADHVERFRHRVDFDADVAGAGDREEAVGFAVVAENAVGGVLDDDDVVLLGEGDCLFVELGRGGAAGGAVGVAEDEEFRFGADVGGDAFEIGEEIVLGGEREFVDDAAVVAGVGAERSGSRGRSSA